MNLYNTNSIPLGLIYLQLNYCRLIYKESENYEGSGDASKMIKNPEIIKMSILLDFTKFTLYLLRWRMVQ